MSATRASRISRVEAKRPADPTVTVRLVEGPPGSLDGLADLVAALLARVRREG